ncbi:MAG: protein-disulfide isomerase [Rhodospirillales bacterium CG15_BIG_FIL_POST_REV_8_21_14_020_66_15]|nr:MAG: protein-disulfide isomerase [Rhodospirillales bacterium CG15_BIG_FIL_POST_REV_8_21_14_020_66_15]
MSRHFLYVADPMCSWCWGFSPVIGKVAEAFGDRAPVRVMVGGLRPGTVHPMRDKDKDYVRSHWEHVQEASGQPFDFAFFDRDGFVYDTEPACRAVVTARKLDEERALPFLARLHRAFYVDNRNTAAEGELADIAGDFGFHRDEFHEMLTSPDTREETQGDFWFAQQSGITGFPTLLAVEDQKAYLVTAGYQSWENLAEPLAGWVAG